MALYTNDCSVRGRAHYRTTKPVSRNCMKRYKGTGSLIEQLNDHYGVVRFPERVDFEEGDVVEVRHR